MATTINCAAMIMPNDGPTRQCRRKKTHGEYCAWHNPVLRADRRYRQIMDYERREAIKSLEAAIIKLSYQLLGASVEDRPKIELQWRTVLNSHRALSLKEE